MTLSQLPPRLASLLRARHGLFALVVFSCVATFLCYAALQTPSDIDEGYFALAFELVGKGRTLYRDFFYPQAPLLPYLMAPLAWVTGGSLGGFRFCMGIAGAATATLLAVRTVRDTSSRAAGFAAAAFVAFHELGWQWLTAVKAYGVASLLATGALLLVTAAHPPSRRALVAAGILASAAVSVRLLVAPVVPVLLVAVAMRHTRAPVLRGAVVLVICGYAFLQQSSTAVALSGIACAAVLLTSDQWRRIMVDGAAVASGLALGAIPAALLYLASPANFVFGNIGYHALRGGTATLFGSWEENRMVLFGVLGIHEGSPLSAAGAQFSLLVALSVASIGSARDGARRLPWLGLAALSAVMDLRPNGIHEQYFATSIPGFALCAAGLLGDLFSRARPMRSNAAILAVAAYYGAIGEPSFERKSVLGMYDPWDMSSGRPVNVDRVCARVREAERSLPGPILPTWPGYALGSAGKVVPGYEDHFARWVADRVPSPKRESLRLKTAGDFLRDLASRNATVLVIGREIDRSGGEGARTLAAACGYRPFGDSLIGAEVYLRSEAPTAACR